MLLELENVMDAECWSCFTSTMQDVVLSENDNEMLGFKEQIMPSLFMFCRNKLFVYS